MKNIIRITESELKKLIIEAVKKSLNEGIRINRDYFGEDHPGISAITTHLS